MTDTLFNTNSLFTLSGNQPYQKKEMSIPEKKERVFDVKPVYDWKLKYDAKDLLRKGLITEQEFKEWR